MDTLFKGNEDAYRTAQFASTLGTMGVMQFGAFSPLTIKEKMVRVGRWMSRDEYNKMVSTGRVQPSNGNVTHVTNPANIDSFKRQAPPGSVYVEFNVPQSSIVPGGRSDWGIIPGPGSLYDRLNQHKGLPPITEMPPATNITLIGGK